jgi:hypothetical protein
MIQVPFIISGTTYYNKPAFFARIDNSKSGLGFSLKGKDLSKLKARLKKECKATSYNTVKRGWIFLFNPAEMLKNISINLVEKYRNGGVVKNNNQGTAQTSNGINGGILQGESHAEGGIEAVVITDNNRPVELEGGEGILSKATMDSEKRYNFEGQMLTSKEIASKINTDHGGRELMEKGGVLSNPENPAEYTWDELPDILKVPTNVAKVKIKEISPVDPGIVSIFSLFVANDQIRPEFTGVYFDNTNLVASDSHKLINYVCDAGKKGIFELKTGKEIEGEKYPEYWNIFPVISNAKEVDVITLKTYCEAALNFANTASHLVKFSINDYQIGFKGTFLIHVLSGFLKLGYTKIYAYSSSPDRPILFTPDRKKDNYKLTKKDTLALLMPIMFSDGEAPVLPKSEMKFGAQDIDFGWSLSAYFDFDKNCIVSQGKEYRIDPKATANTQANLTIEQTKVVAMLSKLKQHTLPILDLFMVKDGSLVKTNLESTLIINNCGLPDGLYNYRNALLMEDDDKSNNEYGHKSINDFPIHPTEFTGIGITQSEDLKNHLLKAFEFVSGDELRPIMNGVLFDFDSIYSKNKDQIALVSTDASALSIDLLDMEIYDKKDFILPYSRFNELCLRLFDDGATSIFANFTGVDNNKPTEYIQNVKFVYGNVELISRVVEGEFPKYGSVVPTDLKHAVSFPKSELLKLLATKKAKDLDRLIVTFDIKPDNKLRIIIYQKPEFDPYNQRKGDEQLEVNKTGVLEYNIGEVPEYQKIGVLLMPIMAQRYKLHEEYGILLSGTYLKTILKNLESEEVNMYWDDETRAAFFNDPTLLLDESEPGELKQEDDIFGESDQYHKSDLIPGITKEKEKIFIAYYGSIDAAVEMSEFQFKRLGDQLLNNSIITDSDYVNFKDFIIEKKKQAVKAEYERKQNIKPKFKEGDKVEFEKLKIDGLYYSSGEIVYGRIPHLEKQYWYTIDIGHDKGQLNIPENELKLKEKVKLTIRETKNNSKDEPQGASIITEPTDYELELIADKVFAKEELTDHEKQIWDKYQIAPTGYKYDYEGNLIDGKDEPQGASKIEELQSIIAGFNTLSDIAETTAEKQELNDIIAGFEALIDIAA